MFSIAIGYISVNSATLGQCPLAQYLIINLLILATLDHYFLVLTRLDQKLSPMQAKGLKLKPQMIPSNTYPDFRKFISFHSKREEIIKLGCYSGLKKHITKKIKSNLWVEKKKHD